VSAKRRLPTRIIDVSKLRVIDSKNLPIKTPYLTLSHCWGQNPSFVRLTSITYEEYYDSIPWTSLPQTFKDALELTRSLGFGYIWIDALCIVQDSKSDWQYEAALMGDVYAHGNLNIAATTSNSGAGGILPRDSRPFSHCLIGVTDGAGNSHTFRTHKGTVFPHNIEDPVLAPLGNRAWVVQERLLSPRIVHFVSDQVFWECCCNVWAELFDNDYLLNADSVKRLMGLNQTSDSPHSASELYHGWIDIVTRYSSVD
jgi:Heterokaryon incompatibility protein (HET)